MEIEGAVALVAGGASGLGAATAARLMDAGARVVVADLRAPDGMEFVEADVRDPDAVAAAVAAATALGPLRIAVCCAGVADTGRVLRKGAALSLDAFRKVVDINLIGTFNVVRLAAEAMAAQDEVDGERGVIVTTASIAAYDGQIGQAAYAASKGGVVGMTLPLARDLATSRVRCVAIAPGVFATPMLEQLTPAARTALESTIPHPSRLGDPSEYAALIHHVITNPMINGETIRIDGALRMGPR